MTDYNSNKDKSGGRYGAKPATVELSDGRVIDAAHHYKTGDNRLLHLSIDERAGGSDVTVPLTDAPCAAYAKTERGREALGITDDDPRDDPHTDAAETVTDGGVDE